MKRSVMMRLLIFIRAAVFTCIMLFAFFAQATQITLVDNSTATAVIVPGSDEIEEHAAIELQAYIEKISGVTLPIIEVGVSAPGLVRILIGTCSTNSEIDALDPGSIDIASHSLGREGTIIKPVGTGRIILAGAESPGALYAVYEFLEEYLGVRWFFPSTAGKYYRVTDANGDIVATNLTNFSDDPGEYVPVNTTVTVDITATDHVRKPSLAYRGFNPICSLAMDNDWMARNRLNLRRGGDYEDDLRKRGFRCMLFDATMGTWFPRNAKDENDNYIIPDEYFTLWKDGDVNATGVRVREQPCVSNPNVATIVANNILSYLSANPDAVNEPVMIGQSDLVKWCQCDNCIAMDDSSEDNMVSNTQNLRVSTRWHKFLKNVGNILRQTYPNIKLATYAYQGTLEPAVLESLDDDITVIYCNYGRCTCHEYGSLDEDFETGAACSGLNGTVIADTDGNMVLSTTGAAYSNYSVGSSDSQVHNLTRFNIDFRFKFLDGSSFFYLRFLEDDSNGYLRAQIYPNYIQFNYSGYLFPENNLPYVIKYYYDSESATKINLYDDSWYRLCVTFDKDVASPASDMTFEIIDEDGKIIRLAPNLPDNSSPSYELDTPMTNGGLNLIAGTTSNIYYDDIVVARYSPDSSSQNFENFALSCPKLKLDQARIKGWGKLAPVVNYSYYGNMSPGYPHDISYLVSDELQFLKRNNGAGWTSELCPDMPPYWYPFYGVNNVGDYVNADQAYELMAHDQYANKLTYYVAAKLMWNIDADVEAVKDDFFTKFYGPAAANMKLYHEALEKAWKKHDICASSLGKRNHHVSFLDSANISEIDGYLSAAATAAASGSTDNVKRVARDTMLFNKWKSLYNDYLDEITPPGSGILFSENFQGMTSGMIGLSASGTAYTRAPWHGEIVEDNGDYALSGIAWSAGLDNPLANRWRNFETSFRFMWTTAESGPNDNNFYLKYLTVPKGSYYSEFSSYNLTDNYLRAIVTRGSTTLQYVGTLYDDEGVEVTTFTGGSKTHSLNYSTLDLNTWYWMIVSADADSGEITFSIKKDTVSGGVHMPDTSSTGTVTSYDDTSELAQYESPTESGKGCGGIFLNVYNNEVIFDDFQIESLD